MDSTKNAQAAVPNSLNAASSGEQRVFALQFWPDFLINVFSFSIGAAFYWTFRRGLPRALEMAVTASLIVLVSCLASYIRTGFQRIEIDGQGIRLMTKGGLGRSILWNEITRAQPSSLLWMRHLKLDDRPRASGFVLPLTVKDRQGLRQAILAFAPADSPLRRYVETGL